MSVPEDKKISIEMQAENWAFGDVTGAPRGHVAAKTAPAGATGGAPPAAR